MELEAAYAQCAPAVYRRARTLLGRDDDAWDAVQEVFERMIKHSAEFRHEANPMTWAYRITTNVCLNVIRGRGVRERGGEATEGELDAAAESMTSMTGVEARNVLQKWVTHLNEREVNVATLLFIDGLTQDEVAQVLGLSRKTIGREVEALRAKAASLGALPLQVKP